MPLPGRAAVRCLLVCVGLVLAAGTAHAQKQEPKLLDRIMHPNMDLHFDGFERSYDTKASGGDKRANVRSFGFGGRSANMKTGDGAFRSKAFNDGRGSFATDGYAVRRATAVDRQALPQADRTFGTRSVDVREDRAANRSAATRDYVNTNKPYLIPGRRQNNLDEIRDAKNLNVEQIRELLNKNR